MAVGPLYEGQQYGIALKKGSEWVGPVNEALAEIKEDSTYKTIYEKWFLRWPATAYIEIFRGTPILVQVLFIFYGLPDLIGGPIDPLTAGIAAIALNSGAYISEVVRGGVQSIAKGQSEAGLSLGLSRTQTFWSIIWPQAFRRMIPPLGN